MSNSPPVVILSGLADKPAIQTLSYSNILIVLMRFMDKNYKFQRENFQKKMRSLDFGVLNRPSGCVAAF